MKKQGQPQFSEEIERRLARLSAFEEVSRAVGASLDLKEICQRALDATLRVIGGRAGSIYEVDRITHQLRALAFAGVADEFRREFAILLLDESSLTGKAAITGQTQLAPDVRPGPISRKAMQVFGIRSAVFLPIVSRTRVLGVIDVVFGPQHKASPEDIELLSEIVPPIGAAMDNAQLHQQTVDLNSRLMISGLRLRSLLRAAEDINSKLEPEQVLHRIVELAVSITGATAGIVAVRENDQVIMHEWWDGRHWRPFEFTWEKGEGGPGWVFVTHQPYLGVDAATDPHTVPELRKVMNLRNFIVAPMLSREGAFLGAVEVENKARGEPFNSSDVDLVVAFSRLAAVALQNARLFQDVSSIKNLLQTMIDNAVSYIIYLDSEFAIRRLSRRSADFFGMKPEELIGKNVFEVFLWLREHEAAECLRRAVETGKRQSARELRLTLPGRAETYWDVVFAPVKNSSGKVEGVVSIATDVTDKVMVREAVEAWARREKAVNEVALAVNSEAGLHDVLRTVVERLAEVLGAYSCAIFLLDPEGKRIKGVIASSELGIPVENVEFDLRNAPTTRKALRSRRPVFLRREETSPLAARYIEEIGILEVICVPLVAMGKPIGVIYVVYRVPKPQPSPEEMGFAIGLANQCAVAIEKARILEDALTQRRRLEAVIEQMPGGVVVAAAPEGRVILLNRLAREMVGKDLKPGVTIQSLPELLGLCHPSGQPLRVEDLALYRALFQGQTVRGLELAVRKPGKRTRSVMAGAVPLRDEEGRVREAVLVMQDTTPLKEAQHRAEEAANLAERQKAEMDAVVETLAEGVLIADAAGNILRANQAAAKILGFRSTEEVYRRIEAYNVLDIRDPQGHPIPLEQWPLSRAMRGETFAEQEIVLTSLDGHRHHLLVGGSSVRGSFDGAVLAIIVFRDITTIRNLERQREEFISVIAHDLRAALTVARGYVQILLSPKMKATMPEKAQKPLDAIYVSTKRLEKMISDLLDVSRIEARRLKLEKRPVDLGALVRSVVERSAELTKGHFVRVEVQEPLPTIMVDPDRIEQILSNLLSNAAKYSYPQTPITIDVRPRARDVMVSVTNLGKGIRSEDIPRLFTRFYRTEEATREKVPGLGLGLYIAKGLVEAHGGDIWVESEPGEFATFRFTIPVAARAN